MAESIKELRRICQDSKETSSYKMSYFQKTFYRSVSIYFTKLFLKVGISANQVTLIGFVTGIIAGVFLTFGDPEYWVIGALLLYISSLLDYVDGEVARYNHSASPVGGYLDVIVTFFIMYQYIPVCMCFGIYNSLHHTAVLIIGLLVVTSLFLLHGSGLWAYRVFHGIGLLYEELIDIGSVEASKIKILMKWGMVLFSYGFILTVLVTAIVDLFIFPFTIRYIPFAGSIEVNARYLYFIIYGIAALAGAIVRIYYTVREGIRLRRS